LCRIKLRMTPTKLLLTDFTSNRNFGVGRFIIIVMFKYLYYKYVLWKNRRFFLKLHQMYVKEHYSNPLNCAIDAYNSIKHDFSIKRLNEYLKGESNL